MLCRMPLSLDMCDGLFMVILAAYFWQEFYINYAVFFPAHHIGRPTVSLGPSLGLVYFCFLPSFYRSLSFPLL